MDPLDEKKQREPDESADNENKQKKGGGRQPANTAFKQQRLKGWQPILTPKTVLPTLFIIGLLFGPIEMIFDYTECENLAPSPSNFSLNFVPIPSNKYSYLEFNVPAPLDHSVFLYYKLSNFFQNHRRYVKSFNSDQLQGKLVTPQDLDNSDCKPLATDAAGRAIYPCGLIANSIFNDTFSSPILLGSDNQTYQFSSRNIAWPGEKKKYVSNPIGGKGYASVKDILRFPNGYTTENMPDLAADEHFQNWMRTAGLPTFTKLYGRNDHDQMVAGTYRIIIGLNFPIQRYKGTKSIVISTVSWIGGKDPFLGWAYVAAAAVVVLLAVAGTARHMIKPRRLGDMSLLSWNR
ncbi:transcription regulator [Mycena floridula]|nr:transcription regulator [Mycena floridula]